MICYLPDIYFTFILVYSNDFRQKSKLKTFFLLEYKMGHKAAATTHKINNAFGLATANEHTV